MRKLLENFETTILNILEVRYVAFRCFSVIFRYYLFLPQIIISAKFHYISVGLHNSSQNDVENVRRETDGFQLYQR